eukprot:1190613-Prorocentrum_minimum.AAC.4
MLVRRTRRPPRGLVNNTSDAIIASFSVWRVARTEPVAHSRPRRALHGAADDEVGHIRSFRPTKRSATFGHSG